MNNPGTDEILSEIQTIWSVVERAHRDTGETARRALHDLLQRYRGAIYRYLRRAIRDPDAAEELAQEFSLRILRGDFRQADPRRGRFRDYLKTALFHLVIDYQRRQRSHPGPLPPDECGPAGPQKVLQAEALFDANWRQELFARTWEALARVDRRSGQPYLTVLRFRAEHGDLSSADMAEQISSRLGRPVTDAWVRQTLCRAREKFTDLLLDELACTLQDAAPERLEQELIDLGLLAYCRNALARRGCRSVQARREAAQTSWSR